MVKAPVLILGYGNDILMDDGIGIKLVNELKKMMPDKSVDFDTVSIGGLEIIEFISDYKTLIIIDAIKTADGIPGTVYKLTIDDFKKTLHIDNLHDVSFLTALEVGKKLEYPLPEKIYIIAIEIIEDMLFGDTFTEPVQAKYPEILVEVREIVEEILNHPGF